MTFIFLKKLWITLKHYWYVPVLAILAIFGFIFLRRGTGLLALIERTHERKKEEIAALESIEDDTKKKEAIINRVYEKSVANIDNDYDDNIVALKKKRNDIAKKLVHDAKDNPELLTQQIAELGGFRIVDTHKKIGQDAAE